MTAETAVAIEAAREAPSDPALEAPSSPGPAGPKMASAGAATAAPLPSSDELPKVAVEGSELALSSILTTQKYTADNL
eukprot:6790847-Alexandrium_andersonii.AAC.1